MTVEIIPAILVRTKKDLEEQLLSVSGAAPVVQIDVVDGSFARPATWPYNSPESFEPIRVGDEALPCWEDIDFQFDIMAQHPEQDIESFIAAGASSVVFHAKSPGAMAAIEKLRSSFKEDTHEYMPSIGIALTPEHQASDLVPFIELVQFVQVMGIAHVGHQGEAFDERAIDLVAAIHTAYPTLLIQVDGGVSLSTIPPLVHAGAMRLVAGSAIFAHPNPREAYRALCKAANE